jgi:hypothetical protein
VARIFFPSSVAHYGAPEKIDCDRGGEFLFQTKMICASHLG